MQEYTVRVEINVTASSAKEAAKFALDDLRDTAIGPINMAVTSDTSGETTIQSVGNPD